MQGEDGQRRKLLVTVIAIKEDGAGWRLSKKKIAGEEDIHKGR